MMHVRPLAVATLLLCSAALAGPRAPEQRISLDVKGADLHDLIRLFSQVGRVNFIVDDDVAGKVTLSLRNVRWQDALEAVLGSRGLGMEKKGSIVRVAHLRRLSDEAAERVRLQKLKRDAAPLVTHVIPVNYARASDLAPQVKATLSERGTVSVDERTNSLIVRDAEP
ncbi:MAG: secretin and TonB N-terminal domain-containing protein [Myxococcales bacterium]|nr:secretin and TonB N-terminal domain-containing protein [Myxococcales bacterium]